MNKSLLLLLSLLFWLCPYTYGADFGTASYYTTDSCLREGTSGYYTASGDRFIDTDLTCAMRSRQFGKRYKVTNVVNNKFVIVTHNDFGPNKKLYKKGRIIDLSKGAFEKIADLKKGIIKVKVERLDVVRTQ